MMAATKKRVSRTDNTNIESLFASALQALRSGKWTSFSCELDDGEIRGRWNDDCDAINIHVRITNV
jgi:hypothetical protein